MTRAEVSRKAKVPSSLVSQALQKEEFFMSREEKQEEVNQWLRKSQRDLKVAYVLLVIMKRFYSTRQCITASKPQRRR